MGTPHQHTSALRQHRPQLRYALALLLLVLTWVPGSAQAWWNDQWSYRKPVTIDSGAQGAAVSGEVKNFPVLIRLHEGIFNFSDAQPDGSDIRFIAGDDKTPLNFHIEKFDPAFNLAFIWVQVPDVSPDSPQKVFMYYGNPKAKPASAPAQTYGNEQVAVYHFGNSAQQNDITEYKNNPTSSVTTSDGGLIWYQGRLGGASNLTVPASPSTSVPQGGDFTWSAWFKLEDGQQSGTLLTKYFSGGQLAVDVQQGAPYLTLQNQGATQSTSPGFPISDGGWHQIAVVGNGQNVTLYVDGRAGQPLSASVPALNGELRFGGTAAVATSVNNSDLSSDTSESETAGSASGNAGVLSGQIDEVHLAKSARSASYLSLEVNNQGSKNTLLSFGDDQENAGWGAGYLGVLLGSVTVDGWVVIAILMIMAVISWFVMVQKGLLISRVQSHNEDFLDIYRGADGIQHVNNAEIEKNGASESPMNRIFQTGRNELSKRMDDIRERNELTAQSIEAIRSELYSQLILENQRLNKRMVLLTIAISGGPFLGLLGTVVGVMITFAAIASSGQVDVAAIAPGIAAALVATVAGLAVAIPALFGYNYLITRIKEIGAQLEMFLDEFVTRVAESYDRPDMLGRMGSE